MSVIKVTQNDIENLTLVTTPKRSYSSGSVGSIGSVKVFPRLSVTEKVQGDVSNFFVVDNSFETNYRGLNTTSKQKRSIGQSIEPECSSYIGSVESSLPRNQYYLEVERLVPTPDFTRSTLVKNNIRNVLMKNYISEYPSAHWGYSNYHSLNFFTAFNGATQLVPTSSVLLYANINDTRVPSLPGYVDGTYNFSGSFTFDFYINPRYKSDGIDSGHFKAGTIFHLSSSYCLSLVTGSLKDYNGEPEGFRLQLHLSHSADYSPSTSIPGPYPRDLIFLSDDNSLQYNNWHHVIVRWGTNAINNGTGSFVIDGVERGTFVIPSGTVCPKSFFGPQEDPHVLFVGNYYEGTNSGTSSTKYFFSTNPSLRFGATPKIYSTSQDEPTSYNFRHPLKAEIHDLVFRRYYMSDVEIASTGTLGIGLEAFDPKKVSFYLPPYFVEKSQYRFSVNGIGGIMQTPFFAINEGWTDDPFNAAMAFSVNAHYINLENFTKDFATGRPAIPLRLTGSLSAPTSSPLDANQVLYADGGVAKRNLTILPCDDGNFIPNYAVLEKETYKNKYAHPSGVTDYGYIRLDNIISGSPVQSLRDGPTPEYPGRIPSSYATTDFNLVAFDPGVSTGGWKLEIQQRTLDTSSNQITIFNISNLYYGRRIQPGTFEIRDSSMSGSHGIVGVTLRDDSMGNIYRADSLTVHATQNSVGNIFYDEGIVVIKNPHLYFFGKNQYDISFNGVFNIYTQKYEILADSGLLNSSSNESFEPSVKPSGDPRDEDPFVYISGLNFHDENMNVVAKARLAQPIIKRENDRILFKITFDY